MPRLGLLALWGKMLPGSWYPGINMITALGVRTPKIRLYLLVRRGLVPSLEFAHFWLAGKLRIKHKTRGIVQALRLCAREKGYAHARACAVRDMSRADCPVCDGSRAYCALSAA